jgi:hypothetical protein
MRQERNSRFLLTAALAVATVLSAPGCKDAEDAASYYAVAAASPGSVAFGVVPLDATSAQPVTVSAQSADFVVLAGWELTGEQAGDFAVTVDGGGDGPWAIEPAAPLTLRVTFAPGATGERRGTLVLRFAEDAEGYHVLGGGCASDPDFGPSGTPLQPAPLEIPLLGLGADTPGGPPCTDEDQDGYQILVPDGCDPWANVPPGGGPPKLEPPVCDKDPNRHPDRPDPCDGTDNDCDGVTDEDFQSEPITCGVGECRNNGLTRCVAGEVRNVCVPLAPPTIVDETCDRRDDDCDGQTDEDFDGGPTTCGRGVCAATGERTCEDGIVRDTCVPGEPTSEDDDACDGLDSDCDGQTDEDYQPETVTCGTGACVNTGTSACVDGEVLPSDCTPLDPPALIDDSCDGVDSDCDGQTDEDFLGGTVLCGLGACQREGSTACVDGEELTVDCVPGAPLGPTDPTCDAVDDDCDGLTDEDWVAQNVTCGAGVCERTVQNSCVDGEVVTPQCTPGDPLSETDATCDGVDDDCDGLTDEDYVGGETTCGVGACERTGSTACVDGEEIVVACTPGDPLSETDATCDGVDDDCDGLTDEDYIGGESTCGVGACERTGSTACVDGEEIVVACTPGDPLSETDATCDGVDDDCDGLTDEDFVGGESTCGVGVCERTGSTACVDGEEVVVDCLPGDPLSETDATCDGVDDDCDGLTDEDFEGDAVTCGVGACERRGGVLCIDGEVTETECVPGEPLSETDATCDGVDDDCDGLTDEDYVPETITCGTGVCLNEGQSACVDGAVVPGECTPLDPPTDVDDDCDGLDDDCDGQTDEDFEGGATTCGEGLCEREGTQACVDGEIVVDCTPGEPAAFDDPCTELDEDCDGLTDEDLPLAGDLVGTPGPGAACAPIVPVLWDGTAEPAVSDVCLGFTNIGVQNGTITVTTSPAVETGLVGPGVAVRDGALWVRTLPVDVQLWYELEFTYPLAGQTVGVQMTVQLDDYLGDVASPGAALYLSNGVHGVWLNIVRDGVYVYTGEGAGLQELGFVAALTQSVPHTFRLVLADDAHVRVEIDGTNRVTFPNALATAALDPVPRVRFGDWSDTAGAIAGWDELALFNLPVEQLDQDVDGASICDGDCDDDDPARSPDFVDDVCTTVDEDCDPTTGLGPDGEAGLVGGPVVDSCRDVAPSLWTGGVRPEELDGCLPFLPVTSGAEPALTFEGGALRLTSTAGGGTHTWTVAWPDPALPAGAWLVARARVRVESYLGAADQPGNALFLADGAHRVWLNLTADGVALLGGAGTLLGAAPFDTTTAVHDYWLVLAPGGDLFVQVDGRGLLSVPGGATLADATPLIEAGFGDASDTAGATARWGDFGFFVLTEPGRIDRDGDGYPACDDDGFGDCDDADPTIHPGQGDLPGDGVDRNCDGAPDDKPYCRGPECTGPQPDPDPIPGSGGCYRVFEYPDGWDGDAETLNMGQSGGTLGDIDLDGIADFGFNHDNEVYLRFGEPAAFGLGLVSADPLATPPTRVDVVVGSLGEPVAQLGLSGVTGGDLNGDGIADVVIGTRFATDGAAQDVGRVYVFFGREEWDAFYDASEANLIIEKSGQDDWTSSSVTAVNDLNGDGLDEIGIKAKDAFSSRDRFYVFFGRAEWDTTTSLTLTNDDADVRYIDPTTYFVTGVGDAVNIASAGDFDGDGFNDMALGTPGRLAGRGAAWLVFGGAGAGYWPDPAVPAQLAAQPNVLRFDRTVAGSQPVTGAHVSQGGDLNADGFADLVFTGRGTLYIVPGRPRAELLDQLGVAALGDPTLFYDPTVQGDYVFTDPDPTYPFDMAYTGDVDGDGYHDVLVSTGTNAGPEGDLTNVSYLLYGGPVLDWPQESAIRVTYDACFHHGQSLVSAHVGPGGDFNADGKDDMVFAAPLRQEVRILYGDWY